MNIFALAYSEGRPLKTKGMYFSVWAKPNFSEILYEYVSAQLPFGRYRLYYVIICMFKNVCAVNSNEVGWDGKMYHNNF